jgi:dTDP-glucose 4,6-dehydratase
MVESFLKTTDWEIIILDKLTYAANGFDRIRNIQAFDNKRVRFFTYDLTTEISKGIIQEISDVGYILHLAAETHVDRSIEDPKSFVLSNVVGTANILDFARRCENLKAFCLFSTDEVFGPAPAGVRYREWDRYNCTNPYAATKAGAEQLTLAYMNTYGLPGFIIHCMNVFGERQHPEKFIPMCIKKVLNDEEILIHSDSTKTISGSRFYIHARNVAAAVHFLIDRFEQREIYNIVGEKEISNLKLAELISIMLGKPLRYRMIDFHSCRPGHDLRYALDGEKMKDLGWTVPMRFKESLKRVVEWTIEHREWMHLGTQDQLGVPGPVFNPETRKHEHIYPGDIQSQPSYYLGPGAICKAFNLKGDK